MEPPATAERPHRAEYWTSLFEDDLQPEASRQGALRELIAGYAREIEEDDATKASGNALAVLLNPLVIRIARMVARGMGQGDRDDFVEEAVNLVVEPREQSLPRICSYRPEDSTLQTWLSVVLGNLWRSRRRAHRPTCSLSGDVLCEEPLLGASDSLFQEPFSKQDLETLVQWQIHWRVELLCLSGLWVKVSAADWKSWLEEYESIAGNSLGRPFPPSEFLVHDDHAARMAPLARALGIPKGRLIQHWHRARVRRLWEELSCL
jgi:DNA-directed RNA polymerase specialized sigma24 family protein